ncbi:hypothetical protein [Pseudomonas sp. GOM6]|uniref:hypothetical protein n=1 Tax=Pseudomonas sp. GOM6 TaxID=3036944 RepID=UPI0024090EB7|nr:hypothetical protein [Pseudomonas sp. GOM6]MDG1581021.1 hypothetical protein [Pseudomonas sp. GOM6]
MSTGPTHFKYFCSRCQVEHIQPISGPAPRLEDIPTSCGNDFPAFPSAVVAIPPEKYMEAMEACCQTPKVFFDGETILVPENEHQVIAMLIESFSGVATFGHAKEYEYATLASQAGIGGKLLILGQAVSGRTGQSAAEMVSQALDDPAAALLAWNALYGSSMLPH